MARREQGKAHQRVGDHHRDRDCGSVPQRGAEHRLEDVRDRRLAEITQGTDGDGRVFTSDNRVFELGRRTINLGMRVLRRDFRFYVHPHAAIIALVEASGLRASTDRFSGVWRMMLFERG